MQDEQLRTAAAEAHVFIAALIEHNAIPDVLFHEGERIVWPVDAPLDPTQPWDAQAEDVRDALWNALQADPYKSTTGGVK